MYKIVSGTKDILPEDSSLWQKIENISREIFSLYNFQEIRTPVIEDESLFNRSLGKETEIVKKQMFVIRNKDENYVLRPEGTAPIVRSYIENNLDKSARLSKFYYIGPMFRLERPQKGRLRQFHHIGCEAIGSYDSALDVEMISLCDALLKGFSIQGYVIKINSLGCLKDKEKLADAIRKALSDHKDKLCQDCKERFKGNPLRILDCKKDICKDIVKHLNIHDSYLCVECREHFKQVTKGLDSLGIGYEIDFRLVRGLDYYNQTVFEITHSQLGSQDAIGAGGRYNNLVSELGGVKLGAIGFAFGVERVIMALGGIKPAKESNLVYIITLGEKAKQEGIKILHSLRKSGISADMDYEGKSVKGAMRRGSDLKAINCLIIGDNEIDKGVITVKNMSTGEQREVRFCDLIKEIKC